MGDEPAWRLPATRRSMWIKLAQVLAIIAVGAGLLAWFAFSLDRVDQFNADLVAHGTQEPGLVESVTDDTRAHSGALHVSYSASGRAQVARVEVGSDASAYRPGQRVTVYYDHLEPTRMTIAGEQNQSAFSAWLMVFSLVLGVFALAFGLVFLVGWLRCRRVLGRHPWLAVRATVHLDAKTRVIAEIDRAPAEPVRVRSVVTKWFTPSGLATSGPSETAFCGSRGTAPGSRCSRRVEGTTPCSPNGCETELGDVRAEE